MASLLDLTTQGDVATITDESKLMQIQLMTPRQLYELWERQSWISHQIDFTQDRRDWEAMPDEEREEASWGLANFFVGEERVATQFSGLVMAYEDQHEEAFLTTQQVDEARHAQHFNRLYENVAAVRRQLRGPPEPLPRAAQRELHRALRRAPRQRQPGARREPARHRGQDRLRRHLPHGHRGHARAHRPVLPDRLDGAPGDPARPPLRLSEDLPGRAPPRRLRHVVPAAARRATPPTPSACRRC